MTQHSQQARNAEQPLSLGLTYRGLITQIAQNVTQDGFRSVADLPELTLEQLGAILAHYPGALLESIVEFDPTCSRCTQDYLADARATENDRLALVGLVFVAALRKYVLPIVLRDVQIQVENKIVLDRIEHNSLTRDVLTVDQLQAFELGLGRGH